MIRSAIPAAVAFALCTLALRLGAQTPSEATSEGSAAVMESNNVPRGSGSTDLGSEPGLSTEGPSAPAVISDAQTVAVAEAFAARISSTRAALQGCPAEDGTWNTEVWQWEPGPDEFPVSTLELGNDATEFGLLAAYEGTSIILRVRDVATDQNVAVIKTTSSNTRVDAEIYGWRLANLLGFGSLVAPTAPVSLRDEALQKMRDLLADTRYDDEYKESNRRRVVRELDEALEAGMGYNGAIKPWIPAFSYVGALGERERLAEHPVMEFLDANGDQPDDEAVRLEQFTRLYSPRGTQRGQIAMWELAEDVSNLLLLDALMGQNDRYAGANVHFRSVSGTRVEAGERRSLPIWDLGGVRLFALDNGAALRGQNGSGIADIQGRIVSGTRVERFEPESVEHVRGLARHVLGTGCPTAPVAGEVDAILQFLGVTPGSSEAERAVGYLANVVEYIDEIEASEGSGMWLESAFSAPAVELSADAAVGL